jgi:hypothetical protein
MQSRVSEAKKKAAPHWKEAEAARERASVLERRAREAAAEAVALRKSGGAASEAEALWGKEKQFRDDAKAALAAAKVAERAGDALYWPTFNLDSKNPFGADALEHLPPETLAESIAKKSVHIATIMQEIKAILSGSLANRTPLASSSDGGPP